MIPNMWLIHFLGIDNPAGRWELFWSGIGSDIGELAIVSAVVGAAMGMWHKHNCHAKGCWKIGKHKVEGTDYVTCRTHHPEDAPTAEHIKNQWQAAKDGKNVGV